MANSDIYFEITILTNISSPFTSDNYNISAFNRLCLIVKITSGQLDVQVSNDGSNFVTYESLTSDGYLDLMGFRFIRLVVSSGTVLSAVMVAKRRYSLISAEVGASKKMYRHRRLDNIGWGKGDI